MLSLLEKIQMIRGTNINASMGDHWMRALDDVLDAAERLAKSTAMMEINENMGAEFMFSAPQVLKLGDRFLLVKED